jgi:hypothetical protein
LSLAPFFFIPAKHTATLSPESCSVEETQLELDTDFPEPETDFAEDDN